MTEHEEHMVALAEAMKKLGCTEEDGKQLIDEMSKLYNKVSLHAIKATEEMQLAEKLKSIKPVLLMMVMDRMVATIQKIYVQTIVERMGPEILEQLVTEAAKQTPN